MGPTEASPREGRISNESPLGRTLLGRKVGESVTVSAPDGEIVYTITGIS